MPTRFFFFFSPSLGFYPPFCAFFFFFFLRSRAERKIRMIVGATGRFLPSSFFHDLPPPFSFNLFFFSAKNDLQMRAGGDETDPGTHLRLLLFFPPTVSSPFFCAVLPSFEICSTPGTREQGGGLPVCTPSLPFFSRFFEFPFFFSPSVGK